MACSCSPAQYLAAQWAQSYNLINAVNLVGLERAFRTARRSMRASRRPGSSGALDASEKQVVSV